MRRRASARSIVSADGARVDFRRSPPVALRRRASRQAERAGLGVVTTSAWRSTTGCAASTAPLAVASTNSGRLTSASLRDRAWPAERPASPAARRTALEASRAGRSRGHAEELSAESGDVLVVAAPVGRPGLRLVLSHAAHLRAEVRRADVYGNAVRPQQPL